MTVGELQSRMTAREFVEWQAFFDLSPFGYERLDLGPAIVASTIANVNRDRGHRSYAPKDFVPRFGGPRIDSPADLRRKIEGWARKANEAEKRRGATRGG